MTSSMNNGREVPFRLYLVEVTRIMGDFRALYNLTDLPLRLLISFHYYQGLDMDEVIEKYFPDGCPDIFIDSGAFSAWAQGGEVDFESYINFVRRWGHHSIAYATLDHIGDEKKTRANTLRMRREGLNPLDVFHVGEPWKSLRRMCRESSYVALGGMVPHSVSEKKELRDWLKRCFKIAEEVSASEKTDVEFHGFGMTRWANIRDFPWRSVDSSAWGQGFRWGIVPLFDPESGRWTKIGLKDVQKAFDARDILDKYYGVSPADLVIENRWNRDLACAIAGTSFVFAEAFINARRTGRPVEIFLATWPPGWGKSNSRRFADGDTQWKVFSEIQVGKIGSKEGLEWRPGKTRGRRRRVQKEVKVGLAKKAGRINVGGRNS